MFHIKMFKILFRHSTSFATIGQSFMLQTSIVFIQWDTAEISIAIYPWLGKVRHVYCRVVRECQVEGSKASPEGQATHT